MHEFLRTFLAGLLDTGLMAPLALWSTDPSRAYADTAHSWYEGMLAGATPEDALRAAEPPFPPAVVALLLEGFKSGQLDVVVQELLALPVHDEPALSALLAALRDRPPGTAICDGCLRRDLDRLLRRARLEGATEARIGMANDSFHTMEQRFAGIKPITLLEPARLAGLSYLHDRLQHAATSHDPLETEGGDVRVDEVGEDVYRLTRGEQTLELRVVPRMNSPLLERMVELWNLPVERRNKNRQRMRGFHFDREITVDAVVARLEELAPRSALEAEVCAFLAMIARKERAGVFEVGLSDREKTITHCCMKLVSHENGIAIPRSLAREIVGSFGSVYRSRSIGRLIEAVGLTPQEIFEVIDHGLEQHASTPNVESCLAGLYLYKEYLTCEPDTEALRSKLKARIERLQKSGDERMRKKATSALRSLNNLETASR